MIVGQFIKYQEIANSNDSNLQNERENESR